jgi:hypothetical protein
MDLNETAHNLLSALQPAGAWLARALVDADWTDWHGFWLKQIFDGRLLIVWFLPLAPLLALTPQRLLRPVLIASGLLLLGQLFGAAYMLFWLLSCTAFFYLSEAYARECRRTDVLPIGPPLAAIGLVCGWYLGLQALGRLTLPADWQAWLAEHALWVFPLGLRELPWEPTFLAGRETPLISAILFDPHLIGSAYLVARLLHYFVELRRDTIPPARRTLLNFLAWTCYGGNVMQGPLERFPAFHEKLDACAGERGWRHLLPALGRIALGVGKSVVSTLYFVPILWELGYDTNGLYYGRPHEIESYALLYFGVFFQIFGLYLEFSGYCDVSAGIARLWGYRQVENFAMPWLATSLRDFWRRWHISLSSMLRDYVYIPLGGNRRHVTLNLCLTFALCGIWHRPLLKLALWGVLMGLMLSANQQWVAWMERLDHAPRGWLPAVRRGWLRLRPLPQICAWLLTQHAFVFSLLVFFGGAGAWRVVWELLRRPLGL